MIDKQESKILTNVNKTALTNVNEKPSTNVNDKFMSRESKAYVTYTNVVKRTDKMNMGEKVE